MARSSELQRAIDYWVGVPVVWLSGLLRRRRSLPQSPRRIGLVSPSAIGDLILSIGLLMRLARRFPQCELHLFHGASNAGAVPLLPVDVVPHPCNFTDFRRTLREIRRSELDLLIDLTPWSRLTALYAAFSGAPTVGFGPARQRRHHVFDVAVPHLRTRHEIDNLSAIADLFDPDGSYVVRCREVAAETRFPVAPDRVILCHLASGGSQARAKAWPTDHWIELARRLAQAGFSIGFTGVEADKDTINGVLAALGLPPESAFSLCGKLTLQELASALCACRMCITVDTAIVHLASALQVPTVALFGATHSSRWGARSPVAVNLDAPHEESGFVHLGFEGNSAEMEIMRTLSVEVVHQAVVQLLRNTESAQWESRRAR